MRILFKRIVCVILICIMIPIYPVLSQDDPRTQSSININNPTREKNWFDNYKTIYEPMEMLPPIAPSAIGYRSFSDSSYWEYNQTLSSLNFQTSLYYSNSYSEIFVPFNSRTYLNLIDIADPDDPRQTNIKVFDDFIYKNYEGITENEVKWLINNHIITRDPEYIEIKLEEEIIDIGPVEVFYTKGGEDHMIKTDFLMALHKATYGVIESRPLVFNIYAYRKAEKVVWEEIWDPGDDTREPMIIGWNMIVEELKDQLVDAEALYPGVRQHYERGTPDDPGILDRAEFKIRLENDVHYSLVTYQEHDKVMITSPNVFELYLKSFLDKGIINYDNLDPDYELKKNIIRDGPEFKDIIEDYGKLETPSKQKYPAWAFELGPYEATDKSRYASTPLDEYNVDWVVQDHVHEIVPPEPAVTELPEKFSHVRFEPDIVTDDDLVWGKRYKVENGRVERLDEFEDRSFFEEEYITVMEALKFIEVILRQTEGNMSALEAQLVSYKYGANVIDKLTGDDRNTVAFLLAKGILDFEKFKEVQFLNQRLLDEFAFELLYRVANRSARTDFKQIQLTDNDTFWIGKGFSSYNAIINTPSVFKAQDYLDDNGDLTYNPTVTSNMVYEDKILMNVFPVIDTKSIILGDPKAPLESGGSASMSSSSFSDLLSFFESFMMTGTAEVTPEIRRSSDYLASSYARYNENVVATKFSDYYIYHRESVVDVFDDSRWNSLYIPEEVEEISLKFFDSFSMTSPFANEGEVGIINDREFIQITVEKLVDLPWAYLWVKDGKGKPIVLGDPPISKSEAASMVPEINPEVRYIETVQNGVDSVEYFEEIERWVITFKVYAYDAKTALQIVDSNIEFATDIHDAQPVQFVSKIMESGEEIILVNSLAFPFMDPDLVVAADLILVNQRTNTTAVLVPELNVALIGNDVIDAAEDTLMIVSSDTQTYYNIDVVRSLLSNSFLQEISACNFISAGSIFHEELMDVVSTQGEPLGAVKIGFFEITKPDAIGDDGVQAMNTSIEQFINISQFATGNNTLTKEIVRTTADDATITLRIILEWELVLPETYTGYPADWVDASQTPTYRDINTFIYTRPHDPLLQDWWDNNYFINNAFVADIYNIIDIDKNQLSCGYLVPTLTVLYYVDDDNLITTSMSSGENLLDALFIQPIIGEWLQEVGERINPLWVDKFFGDRLVYNKILASPQDIAQAKAAEAAYEEKTGRKINHKYGVDWTEYISSGRIRTQGVFYYITANDSSGTDGSGSSGYGSGVYFPIKGFPSNWYPAWVHSFFNNWSDSPVPSDAKNTYLWRRLSVNRRFEMLNCDERRSDGNVFIGKKDTDPSWVIAASGAVYKSTSNTEYNILNSTVIVDTRLESFSLAPYIGQYVYFGEGEERAKYYFSRIDKQYIELISIDNVLKGQFNNATTPEFRARSVPDLNFERAGYDLLSAIFLGSGADVDKRKDTIDKFQSLSNKMPIDSHYVEGNIYVITDSSSKHQGLLVSAKEIAPGVVVSTSNYLLDAEVRDQLASYNPVIRLSMLGWTIKRDGDDLVLVAERTMPFHWYDGFYPSSMTKTIVESIIARNLGDDILPVSELLTGTLLTIGDVLFYKEGDGSFTSIPLSYVTGPVDQNTLLVTRELVQQKLQQLATNYLNLAVDMDGRISSVASYIQEVRLGQFVDNTRFIYKNTLISRSLAEQSLWLCNNHDFIQDMKQYQSGDFIGTISFNVKFDYGLLAMPIEKDNKAYQLLYTSSQDGLERFIDLDYLPTEYEDMLALNQRTSFEAFSVDFRSPPNQDLIISEFIQEDRRQTLADTWWWFKTLLAWILAYLMFACVLLWYMQGINTVMVLAERWKRPGNGQKGFDVFKILSFGVMSVDNKIEGTQLIKGMTLLFILFVLLILVA